MPKTVNDLAHLIAEELEKEGVTFAELKQIEIEALKEAEEEMKGIYNE